MPLRLNIRNKRKYSIYDVLIFKIRLKKSENFLYNTIQYLLKASFSKVLKNNKAFGSELSNKKIVPRGYPLVAMQIPMFWTVLSSNSQYQ